MSNTDTTSKVDSPITVDRTIRNGGTDRDGRPTGFRIDHAVIKIKPLTLMTESQESDRWTCPECGEEHASIDSKCPGGCLHCVDTIRYIEYEAPGMAMVENDVSEVVCFHEDCDERVPVDPATIVPEPAEAVDIEAREMDPQTGETTGYTRVEIYCSTECRNDRYMA